MEPIEASLYVEKGKVMNIPKALKDAIEGMGWKDGKVYALVDEKKGTVTLVKSLIKNADLLVEMRNAEGEI